MDKNLRTELKALYELVDEKYGGDERAVAVTDERARELTELILNTAIKVASSYSRYVRTGVTKR